jgi:hypothetical protein
LEAITKEISDKWADDDYNFYLQTPDSSFYLGSDDSDLTNQFMALEFDSDEFPDPVDNHYNIFEHLLFEKRNPNYHA